MDGCEITWTACRPGMQAVPLAVHGLYSDDTQQALALCDILLDYQKSGSRASRGSLSALMTPKGLVRWVHIAASAEVSARFWPGSSVAFPPT